MPEPIAPDHVDSLKKGPSRSLKNTQAYIRPLTYIATAAAAAGITLLVATAYKGRPTPEKATPLLERIDEATEKAIEIAYQNLPREVKEQVDAFDKQKGWVTLITYKGATYEARKIEDDSKKGYHIAILLAEKDKNNNGVPDGNRLVDARTAHDLVTRVTVESNNYIGGKGKKSFEFKSHRDPNVYTLNALNNAPKQKPVIPRAAHGVYRR